MSKRTNFRNRKISIKQALTILRSTDIDHLEEELVLQNAAPQMETGVDKEEENETHLVAAITSTAQKPVYIPTPDASRVVTGYEKKYRKPFTMPPSFIRFSATVEDTEGCPYSMDEVDETWLTAFNNGRTENTVISEDAFEWIVHQFETTINLKQPFLSTAPDSILPFEEIESAFDEDDAPGKPYKQFAKFVYPHWRQRRIENGGKPIMPLLRYEENAKDDGDPYVCFRRREIRQIRKTRQTGQSATVRLRGLRQEMVQARQLAELVVRRELLKRDALLAEQALFEKRNSVKQLKRRLGIKGDDDDLITQKQRRSVSEVGTTTPRVIPGGRATTKTAAMDASGEPHLQTLQDYFEEREQKARATIMANAEQAAAVNAKWCDCTDQPFVAPQTSWPSSFFRAIRAIYAGEDGVEHAPPISDEDTQKREQEVFYRQRVGRGGRVMMDRRFSRAALVSRSSFASHTSSVRAVTRVSRGGKENMKPVQNGVHTASESANAEKLVSPGKAKVGGKSGKTRSKQVAVDVAAVVEDETLIRAGEEDQDAEMEDAARERSLSRWRFDRDCDSEEDVIHVEMY
ncbi:enhancer of polycomb-like-domain-containing protein [Protomyces lactucae-debilis]|uniref:Enhancer of polycomb-like protein n=1 Tax=Protomyces lactucae-debilis TaxID=2754530 RepID=A0A1Y2FS49_PROLT|nr:enhancer of polycomb-like-domain-containing protein [Protomyces lactucae-debilis]ORY86832.1 enhancer of polycomb-like-domain-containing protein [Protomyces lactucae-debilis]